MLGEEGKVGVFVCREGKWEGLHVRNRGKEEGKVGGLTCEGGDEGKLGI